MRYDKEVSFVTMGKEVYDSFTGNYEVSADTSNTLWANITNMSENRITFLFGGLTVGAYVVRIQNHYDVPFDYLSFGGKDYNVKRNRKLRRGHTFEVSERL